MLLEISCTASQQMTEISCDTVLQVWTGLIHQITDSTNQTLKVLEVEKHSNQTDVAQLIANQISKLKMHINVPIKDMIYTFSKQPANTEGAIYFNRAQCELSVFLTNYRDFLFRIPAASDWLHSIEGIEKGAMERFFDSVTPKNCFEMIPWKSFVPYTPEKPFGLMRDIVRHLTPASSSISIAQATTTPGQTISQIQSQFQTLRSIHESFLSYLNNTKGIIDEIIDCQEQMNQVSIFFTQRVDRMAELCNATMLDGTYDDKEVITSILDPTGYITLTNEMVQTRLKLFHDAVSQCTGMLSLRQLLIKFKEENSEMLSNQTVVDMNEYKTILLQFYEAELKRTWFILVKKCFTTITQIVLGPVKEVWFEMFNNNRLIVDSLDQRVYKIFAVSKEHQQIRSPIETIRTIFSQLDIHIRQDIELANREIDKPEVNELKGKFNQIRKTLFHQTMMKDSIAYLNGFFNSLETKLHEVDNDQIFADSEAANQKLIQSILKMITRRSKESFSEWSCKHSREILGFEMTAIDASGTVTVLDEVQTGFNDFIVLFEQMKEFGKMIQQSIENVKLKYHVSSFQCDSTLLHSLTIVPKQLIQDTFRKLKNTLYDSTTMKQIETYLACETTPSHVPVDQTDILKLKKYYNELLNTLSFTDPKAIDLRSVLRIVELFWIILYPNYLVKPVLPTVTQSTTQREVITIEDSNSNDEVEVEDQESKYDT